MSTFDKRMHSKNIHWLVFGLWRLSTNLSNTPRIWTIEISLTNLGLNPTYNKRDIRNWKHNDVMFATPEVA